MEEDKIEKLADNEHNRWANWQQYVHSKCVENEDGSLTIPKEYVEHWNYEINTKYEDLPENIKESDRKEVRQILNILDLENLIARYKEIEEYANWHIEHLTEDIADYIDDDKVKNASFIGELKEEREHWKDIKRILKNEKTYIDYKVF